MIWNVWSSAKQKMLKKSAPSSWRGNRGREVTASSSPEKPSPSSPVWSVFAPSALDGVEVLGRGTCPVSVRAEVGVCSFLGRRIFDRCLFVFGQGCAEAFDHVFAFFVSPRVESGGFHRFTGIVFAEDAGEAQDRVELRIAGEGVDPLGALKTLCPLGLKLGRVLRALWCRSGHDVDREGVCVGVVDHEDVGLNQRVASGLHLAGAGTLHEAVAKLPKVESAGDHLVLDLNGAANELLAGVDEGDHSQEGGAF